MSITVHQISKNYGSQQALQGVSLDIRPGEIVGLLGPNGAGKSTLMKILTCFIPPTSGSASVCGVDVMENPIVVRSKTGYLPENNPLYLDMYVREFLTFMAGMRQLRNKVASRVDAMIELTGLGPEQHKKLGALSKGYRQRAGLAQALIHDPEVLILDEPTSGLDPNQLLEIRGLIREIGKKKTVMLSTHIMQEAEAICNRAIIIHQGRIVADNTTHNLQHMAAGKALVRVEFEKEVTADLLKTIPGVIETTPVVLPASPGQITSPPPRVSATWLLSPTPGHDIRAAVFQFAVENNLTVLSLIREEQKLEEVFQELTRNQ